ncbi:metallophosphoesterase family protein [Helicobacter bizzozeronii]|uniref:metallophosphoesterase family protein n=1 Tax=Helicobacter bizzozeronii TaxID=56877 RepID=UPI000CEEC0E2|nr:metallophosphoesterase [Helicobacter bizzozeronii]
MKNYVVSDLHLFHKNIIKYSALPFESVEELNQEWVAMLDCVEPQDIVWYLGDLTLLRKPSKELNTILSNLKGQKILIKGNHDMLPDKAYANCNFQVFNKLFHILDVEADGLYRFIMCHYPPNSPEYNQWVAHQALTEWIKKEEEKPVLKTFWLHGHTHTRQIQSEQVDTINVCIDFRYKNQMPIFCIENFIQELS